MIRRRHKVFAGLAAGLVVMAGALPAIAQVDAIQVFWMEAPASGEEVRGIRNIKVEARSSTQGVETGGIIRNLTIRIQRQGDPRNDQVCSSQESAALCRSKNYETGPFGSSEARARESLELVWNTDSATPLNGLYDVVSVARSDVPGVNDSEVKVIEDVKVNNPPDRPTGLAVSTPVRGEPELTVTWSKNREADLIRYEIARAVGDGGFQALGSTGPGGSSLQDPDVPFDAPVRYRLVAFRASPVSTTGIASEPSTTAAVTVQSPPPPPSPTPSSTPGGGNTSTDSKNGGSELKDLSGKLGSPPAGSKTVKPVSLAAPNSISGPRRDGGLGFGRLLPFGKNAPQSLMDEEFAEAVGDAIRNPGRLISEEIQINPMRFIAAAVLLLVTAGHLGRGAHSLFRSAKGASAPSSPAIPA